MPDSELFWQLNWDIRLKALEDLGKREAILVASRLVRSLAERPGQPVRMLELGCGEGQIIGSLLEAHAQVQGIEASCGVDYASTAIETCRRRFPGMTFIQDDFTNPNLLSGLGQFEIVLLVNALHEVFSAGYTPVLGEIDVPTAKRQVELAFGGAATCLAAGGYLVLFDGLEPPGDIQARLRIRFKHAAARRRFDTFAREYHPFKITARAINDPDAIELSWRDFTRYISKSIFLEKRLWEQERLESYQYFNEYEFRQLFAHHGLVIQSLRAFSVNEEKWRSEVEILTDGANFPAEHVLIVARMPE
jgi:SAM-dependent methyltransferase